ncbi:MAG: hypothetical protein M3Q23_18710 [Actinomycetota bacterium]|nr:hypothetical protein [Actinomycetota bacterium]
MSEQPPGGGPGRHQAVEILSKIVSATDRLKKAREPGGQPSDMEQAQQARREAMQEAREFLRKHGVQTT